MTHSSAYDPQFPQPSGQQQLQLVVHAGPLAGKGFPITKSVLTFGRGSENDITLDDTQVSRNHARLIRQGDEVIIEDLGSTNGTLVNGRPVTGQHMLQPADIISIGSSVFGVRGFSAPQTIGVTQISMDKRTYPPPAAPTLGAPGPQPASAASPPESSGLNMLVISGILVLIVVVLLIAAVTAYFLTQNRGPAAAGSVPTVIITAPTDGSQVQVNGSVTVQATASDPAGVKRVELWVSNIKSAEAISPVEQGQATLTASFQWTPPAPGTYTLEVKAFNTQEKVSTPTTVTLNVAGAAEADTPTTTPTPATATPTVPTTPSLTTKTDLNVRSGSGIQYDLLGLLPAGVTVEIIGRDETRQWWQIRFSPAGDGIGWVAADPAFSTTANVDNVPIAQAPPPPTATPTLTPIPATATPSSTPLAPTDTPTPTPIPTATGEPTTVNFDVSPTRIRGGECVHITWLVTGVREVYLDDQGAGGSADIVDCPKETKTYRFRVVRVDGSEYREEVTVEVIDPIASAGSLELDSDERVDLDRGRITGDGDDFKYEVGDGVRRFEVRNGAQLAPMDRIDELEDLTLDECAGASFGAYSFIDASDDAPDEINKLHDGRSACYRTNEGRLGKIRFPDDVNDDDDELKIEWLTWR